MFIICLSNERKEALAQLYADIRRAVDRQIRLDTITPPLKLAAGAVMLPKHFLGSVSLLQSNLFFSYDHSKYNEHGNLFFYDSTKDTLLSGEHKSRLLAIHSDAIGGRDGFYMAYQPIVSTEDERIVGAEALVRWRDASFGVVPPGDFIPWLEGDPCFVNLGNWILWRALTEAKTMLKSIPLFILNVNVAMPQLEREEFGGIVLKLLEETGFPPNQLCLELTERCRELNPAYLKTQVDFFRSHGIKIALDDFGTGFSSFSLLLGVKVDEIKIDQTFVSSIKTDALNQVLTKMLIDAANRLGYATCLEGVENDDLRRYLTSYNATYFQGYYCSCAVEMEEFAKLVSQWNANQ